MVELSYELIIIFIFTFTFLYFKYKYRFVVKHNKELLEFAKNESLYSLNLEKENSYIRRSFNEQLKAIWKCVNRKLKTGLYKS